MLVKRKISELRVSELRTELEKRNLDSKGLKSTLLQRLQKAILDEGGDIDQIEVNASSCASPINRKNSPRIKRAVELPIENRDASMKLTDDKKLTEDEKKDVIVAEKSVLSLDGDRGEIIDNSSFEVNNMANNGEDNIEEKRQDLNSSVKAIEENNLPDSIITDWSEEANVANDSKSASNEMLIKDEDQNIHQQSHEVDNNGIKGMTDDTSNVDDSDLAYVRKELSEENVAEMIGNNKEDPNIVPQDFEDCAEDTNQEQEDSDNAIEDDVLDMLDYDIEMPDHSQGDDECDSKDGDGAKEDDLKDQVVKTSDESGNKDSNVSSESFKSEKEIPRTEGEGEKLFRNLWISGLSASTRATELKAAFSRYGKIKQDPSNRNKPRNKAGNKDESEEKASQLPQISSKDTPTLHRSAEKDTKESDVNDQLKKNPDPAEKFRSVDRRFRGSPPENRQRPIRRPIESKRETSAEPYRKRPRPIGERKVMIDKKGGMSLRVNVRSTQDGRRDPVVRRVSRSPVRSLRTSRFEEHPRRLGGRDFPPEFTRNRDRDFRTRDVREEISRRKASAEGFRPNRSMALQASIERDKLLLRKERDERNFLRMEREKLERERRQLERDRIERERLEQERIKLEHERKRELEKIEREKAEMKRLQEINRFEQSQRQRALKRMYDGRPHDDRMEGKRMDRDDRRRYDGDSRDRPGPPIDMYYRNDEGGYRSRSGPGPRLDSRPEKMNFHDVDRRNMSQDTDARYGHPSDGGRRVEKYERPTLKTNFDHDRRNPNDVGGNLPYRHHDKDIPDDRKVISRDRGRPDAGSFRRDYMSMKKEPIRGNTGGRPRATDRDLREEIRQGPVSVGRKGSPPHRGDLRHRDDPPPSRSGRRGSPESQKFSDRSRQEPEMRGSTTPPGKPIPTTGKSGMNFQPSSAWPGWQHGDRGGSAGVWHGPNPIPGGAPVGRLVTPIEMAFNQLSSVPPGQALGPDAMLARGISSSFPGMDNNF